MRLVVLVSGRGSNLRAILGAIDAGRCDAEVVAVLADRNAVGLELATTRGIATKIVPLRRGDDRTAWNTQLADEVTRHSPDLIVTAGFMRVLGPDFVQRFARQIVNVHPSILPAFRGMHAARQAIEAGVHMAGCTVHLVDDGVDTGPILAQAAVPILSGDDEASLQARIQTAEHHLLPAVIAAVGDGRLDLSTGRWTTGPSAAFRPLFSPVSLNRGTE